MSVSFLQGPIGTLLLSSLFFSFSNALVKALPHVPIWEIVFFRALFNVIWLLPWMLKNPVKEWKKDLNLVIPRGVFGCLAMASTFYAVSHIRLTDAVILYQMHPLITLLLSPFILGEKLSVQSIFFILVAFMGGVFILKPSFEIFNYGGIFGLLSAVLASFAHMFVKKATKTLPPNFVVFTFAVVASLLSLPMMLMNFMWPELIDVVKILGVGLCATLAQGLMTLGFSKLPANIASPVSLSTLLFSAVLGLVFWNELPDWSSVVGGSLLVAGLIGAFRSHANTR